MLLSARHGGWQVTVTGEDADESAYVAMTTKLIEAFPQHGGEYTIEPDASSASYFLAAGALLPWTHLQVNDWPESDWQIDARFVDYLRRFSDPKAQYTDTSRLHDLGDAIMTAITVAPLLPKTSRFTDLGRLRVQESERVYALRTELTKCGATVTEDGDTLTDRAVRAAWRRHRHVRRPPHRHVLCDPRTESTGHAHPGAQLRGEDLPELLR